MVEEQEVLTPAERLLRSQVRARVRAPIAGGQVGVKLQQALDRIERIESRIDISGHQEAVGVSAPGDDHVSAVLAEMQEQLNALLARVDHLEEMLPSAEAFQAVVDRLTALEERPEPQPVMPEGYDELKERVEYLCDVPMKIGGFEERLMQQDQKLEELAKPKRTRKAPAKAEAD